MDRLLKLLRDNARNRTASTPKAKAEESGEATLYLYDVIVSDDYWGGVAAEAFVKELNATADHPPADQFPGRGGVRGAGH